MYASNYLEQNVLNTLRGTTFTPASTLYLGLFLTSPTEIGSAGTEVNYEGYERKVVTFANPVAASNVVTMLNDAQIEYAQAEQDSGQAEFVGIYDAITGGNMYAYGRLTTPLQIKSGEKPVLLAGELQLSMSNDFSVLWKTKILNLFRATAMAHITPYLALYNGNPDSAGVELSGVNYERVPITFAAPVQEVSGAATIANSTVVQTNRSSTDWGTTNYRAIKSAATSGETVMYKSATERVMSTGRMYQVPVGDLKVGLN